MIEKTMQDAMDRYSETRPIGYSQQDFAAGWKAREALAEKPTQGEAVAFLANGARFKLAALPRSAAFMSFPAELAGKWVALVDATDDRHLLLKAPPAPSVPDEMAKIASIAHDGGLAGLSESDALTAIRRITAKHWSTKHATFEARRAVVIAAAQEVEK